MFALEIEDKALKNFINQLPIDALIERLESKGFFVVHEKDGDNYVNIKKSMGTEPFYDLLVGAIERGELNLELLVGKVAVKRAMESTKSTKRK
ncbi:MAG: hypothetical protein ACOC80_06670 [Petrotogales bacterium]